MEGVSPELVGRTLRRPVLSPDGKFLAAVAPDQRIHLINLAEAAYGHQYITALKVPRSTRSFLEKCNILRWSPETVVPSAQADEAWSNTTSECEYGLTWLLLSDGKRLIAVSTNLQTPRMMLGLDDEAAAKSNILADFELGGQFGRLSLVDFVFNHRHALVMFEFGTNAAVLSLTKPEREEIPHVKFPDSRSLTEAPDARYFALLRRVKGQDRVTVFELVESNQITYKSFDCHTSDAQSLHWCPAGGPVLAVCDSPAYGVNVCFFTAQGHALRQIDITSSTFSWHIHAATDPECVGLTLWRWLKDGNMTDRTIQVATNGQNQVLIRYQSTTDMVVQKITSFTHPEVIDGSRTMVWQETTIPNETSRSTFTQQTSAFEAKQEQGQSSSGDGQAQSHIQNQVDIIGLNANHALMATRVRSSPQTLWVWELRALAHSPWHAHTVLTFSHPIKQVLWHPMLSNVMVILTISQSPILYAWYQEMLPPISGSVPIDTSISTDYSATWLPACRRDDNSRCPFMLTSRTAFEVGYLESFNGRIVFESIVNRKNAFAGLNGDDATEMEIETPSRPSKHRSNNQCDRFKKARLDAEPSPRTHPDDPLYAQSTGAGYCW
ncbi:uncharacterized protein Z518_01884 [Rhinocladiella mackenziei CBS 650.93]|uniref:Uncharacterized protein n=1 Tax=Rhinocladiella mackenziei CBS 650.93 TaxID=1442369 RepID=A0A0D2IVJ8_9EURO|nr:uncharacterized protein Z518_01884 [Rhinocladiella mackenziei CBS 650.93]KIX07231.1 hypothetical protein Z518_01884 [Rhinocladiella mackenziei CBS 650.93]